MSSKKRTVFGGCAFLCYLLCLLFCGALADTSIDIQPGEWTWEANGRSVFQGTIVPDQDVKNAVLTISVETRLDDSGAIQFTAVNEKRLKIRKKGPTTETDLFAGTPLSFEGEWLLPAETEEGLAWAQITIQVSDAKGNVIADKKAEVGSREEDRALLGSSPSEKLERLTLLLSVAGIIVWILAVSRYMVVRKKAMGKD